MRRRRRRSGTARERSEPRLNPTLRLYRSGTTGPAVDVEWSVRQLGTRQRTVTVEADAELLAFLLSELSGRRDVAGSPRLRRAMRDSGMLIAPGDDPRAVALDLHLPHAQPGAQAARTAQRLAVSGFAHLERDGAVPAAIRDRADRGALVPGASELLWVDDPDTGALALYDLSDEPGRAVRDVVSGARPPTELPVPLLDTLVLAGVLVDRAAPRPAPASPGARARVLRAAFCSDELAIIRGAINPVQLAMFRPYLRGLAREGWLRWNELEKDRMLLRREPLCEFLHHQLCPLVAAIVDEPLKPSYSIYAHYHPGAILARHRDRPQCKYNVSLVLDAQAEAQAEAHAEDRAGGDDAWPLYIETRTGVHAAALAPGDAVLYSGTDAWHWRDAQPAGHSLGGAFFHYVPVSFTGSLD